MLWFFLSLFTAFATATEAAVLKRFFGKLKPLEMSAIIVFYSLPFLFACFLFVDKPALGPQFWSTIAYTVPFNAVGLILHMSAVNISPLSLTLPYLAFTPVFVIGIGFFALGESVSLVGFSGICFIIAGSYILNMGFPQTSPLAPFKAIFKEKGSLFMLMAAVIYAFTVVFGKKVAMQSSPVYAALVYFSIMNSGLLLFFVIFGKVRFKILVEKPLPGLLSGFFLSAHVVSHFIAVTMVTTAYMISVKRISGIFSVCYGKIWFGETNIGFRLLGAAVMAAGAGIIVIFG